MKPLYGVVGHPVRQSLSPDIHRAWMREHGIEADYEPIEIAPESLEDFLEEGGFSGLNITIPHKEKSYAYLEAHGGLLDEEARRLKAVNLILREGARLVGRNVDGEGFCRALLEGAPSWKVSGAPVALLGAGGAARALVGGLFEMGQRRFLLIARDRKKLAAFKADMSASFEDARFEEVLWGDRVSALAPVSLLVNASSGGMAHFQPLDISLEKLPQSAVVAEIVYKPLETPLLKSARARNLKNVDGLGMLLHQAALSFEAWFGIRPRITKAMRDALAQKNRKER